MPFHEGAVENKGEEKRVALLIGNSVYKSEGVSPLRNPVNDAKAIARSLKELKFSKVVIEINLDYQQMRRALFDFGRIAEGADISVIYFAGHGIEVGGQNYLIPVDAQLQRASDVEFETASLGLLLNAVGSAKKLSLVILDACRNNPFRSRMVETAQFRSLSRGLAQIEPAENILVAYSAKHGTVAQDGEGENSPYAEALVQHIGAQGQDIRIIFGRVRDTVWTKTGKNQEPFTYGALGGEEIYLKPKSRTTPPRPPPLLTQDVFFQAIHASTDPADFRDFLERFPDPNGTFFSIAKRKLESLEWETVKDADELVLLQSFLDLFPNGKHAREAKAKLKGLRQAEETAWARAKESDDPAVVEEFLKRFPESDNAQSAKELLSRLRERAEGLTQRPAEAQSQPFDTEMSRGVRIVARMFADSALLSIIMLIGAVVGWLAGVLVGGAGFGLLWNIFIGIAGAYMAARLLPRLGAGLTLGGGIVGTIVAAMLGAVVLLLVAILIAQLVS